MKCIRPNRVGIEEDKRNKKIGLHPLPCHFVIIADPTPTIYIHMYSQTCVQWPPLGPEKSGR